MMPADASMSIEKLDGISMILSLMDGAI